MIRTLDSRGCFANFLHCGHEQSNEDSDDGDDDEQFDEREALADTLQHVGVRKNTGGILLDILRASG
jgi:hypothetical protein